MKQPSAKQKSSVPAEAPTLNNKENTMPKQFETVTDENGKKWTVMDMIKERNRKKYKLAEHQKTRSGIALGEEVEVTHKSMRKRGMVE